MSKTQIEAAAAEIASHCEHKSEADIANIIARNLFPVVKAQDVNGIRYYWVLFYGIWQVMDGVRVRCYRVDEIRGPVPMPEVRS